MAYRSYGTRVISESLSPDVAILSVLASFFFIVLLRYSTVLPSEKRTI